MARHEAAVGGAEQMLLALSQTAGLLGPDPAVCRKNLLDVLNLQPARYSNFALIGLDGGIRCSARDPVGDTSARALNARYGGLLKQALDTHTFTLGTVRDSPLIKAQIIPAFMPLSVGGKTVAFLSMPGCASAGSPARPAT